MPTPNPFAGIITADMKDMFTNAIDALLENTACTVPCRLIYGDTLWTDCENCIFDAIGNKSSNRYAAGGPIPFSFGICPVCFGIGRIPDEQTASVNLSIIWDYREWISFAGVDAKTLSIDGYCQSISKMTTTIKDIKRCKEMIINTDIEQYVHHRFSRQGEPNPIGFGRDDFIVTMWKAIR